MRGKLEQIRLKAKEEIEKVESGKLLDDVRVKFLGKKGELTLILRGMGALSQDERPVIGQLANEVRQDIEKAIEIAKETISHKEIQARLETEKIDVTISNDKKIVGHVHPLSIVLDEMIEVFLGMGYKVEQGPEIELDYYNFEALNMPKTHPARDTQDTFYVDENIVLRTQTSPVQIRTMKKQKPPIRIICPGRVYRSDEVDATHSPIFNQVEALVIDKGVTMGDLVGTLRTFAKAIFGEKTQIRLRPHHFPYTEPSAEVDVSCWVCGGKGCRVCKNEGWIEILGAGMVHPNVLKTCDIDPEIYSGFAFGIGLERTAMGRFNIDDMRLLYENDVRFLSQF